MEEWKFAIKNKIPAVLLIEDGVNVTGSESNFVRFNRYNPNPAINEIHKRMQSQKKSEEVSGWLLAGAALLALLAIFSDNKK